MAAIRLLFVAILAAAAFTPPARAAEPADAGTF